MWPITTLSGALRVLKTQRCVAAYAASVIAFVAAGTAGGQSAGPVVIHQVSPGPSVNLGTLDGTWHGTLEVVSSTKATPAQFWQRGARPEILLVINGAAASIKIKGQDWRELRVGDGFRAFKIESSAFVYAVQLANGWVENWNLSVTKKDPNTLLVFLSYVAGGSLERIEQVTTEFAVGAMGELERLSEPLPEKGE